MAWGGTARELSAEDVESLMRELLDAYKSPEFQEDLAALRSECAKTNTHPLLAMAPVTLKVQVPILKKFGQPQNSEGVDIMKHSVERRVAEGNLEIERMANEARAILGIAQMPDRRVSAEDVLSSRAHELSGQLDGNAERSEAFRRQCHNRISVDENSGTIAPASSAYLRHQLDSRDMPIPSVLALHKMAKIGISLDVLRGVNKPVIVPTLEAPNADDFFQNHVLTNRPAVIRGVFDQECFSPLRNFPDASYLRRKCGHRQVLVKSLAHTDTDGRPVFVSDPELKLPINAFLDLVEAHERDGTKQPFYLGKVPLKKELPELAEDIECTATCPQRLYGNCFGKLVPNGVFTYFGCGRNTTPVHFDAHENMLLCVCGKKRLLLYPPSDAEFLYPCKDFSRSAILAFKRYEEYPPDLRSKLHLAKGAHPVEIELGAGDLLYLPSAWWHCVEGSDDRNMILNWWFALHDDKKRLSFKSRLE